MNFLDVLNDTKTSHHQRASQTGALTAGAATKLVFYCRNLSTTHFAMIQGFSINGVYATTAFAAGAVRYQLHVARTFTAENASPAGTLLHPSPALGVIRISTTAVLGAPTWALDQNAIGELASHSSGGAAAATPIIGSQFVPNDGALFECDPARGESPIILGQNEGLALQVTVPATGVWVAGVTMKWAETQNL